jgi:hypothetical protein
MTIAFSCPGCGKQFKVSDNMAGRKAKCSACATIIQVPSGPEQRVSATPESRKPARAPAPADEDAGGDEPAPARGRKTQPKKKGSKVLLFTLLGVGGLLSMCLCCTGGYFGAAFFSILPPFMDPVDLNYRMGGGPPPEYKYLPDNCQMISVAHVDEILESDFYKQIKKELPVVDKGVSDDKQYGMPMTNVSRITEGRTFGKKDSEHVTVIKTKSSVKADDIASKKGTGKDSFKKVTEGDYTIYTGQFESFCVVNDTTVLFGSKETLQKVLKRNDQPKLSDGLKNAMKQVRFTKSAAVAVDLKPIQDEIPKSKPGDPVDYSEMVGKAEGLGVQVEIGSDIEINATVVCKDDKAAEDLKKMIDGAITFAKGIKDLPKEAKDIMESVKVSNSGSKCTVSVKCKADQIIKAGKSSKMGFPFGMGL